MVSSSESLTSEAVDVALAREYGVDPAMMREALEATRLRQQQLSAETAIEVDDDNDDATGAQPNLGQDIDHDAGANAFATAPPTAKPKTTTNLFAAMYKDDNLVAEHAKLFGNYDTIDPSDPSAYLRELQDFQLADRPTFIICTGGADPTLVPLHGIARYARDLANPSKFDGRTFAFIEDVDEGDRANSVEFVPGWLRRRAHHLPTVEDVLAARALNPLASTVQTTPSEEHAIAQACLLPTAWAPYVLDEPKSPLEAWPILRDAATRAGLLTECEPLWRWLLATAEVANDKLRVDNLLHVFNSRAFRANRARVQDTLLPTIVAAPAKRTATFAPATTSPNDPAMAAIAHFSQSIAKALPAATKKPVATVSTKWPYQIATLRRICGVVRDEDLPPLWHALALEKRGTPARVCIMVACDSIAARLKLQRPVVTHQIANMVYDMAFVPDDRLDLVAGLTPFALPTLTPEETAQTNDALRLWDEHLAGLSNPTVAETRQATQKARIAPVLNFVQLYAVISRFEIIVVALLGEHHPVVNDLKQTREFVAENYLFIERSALTNRRLCTQITLVIRNQVLGWFRSAERPHGAPQASRLYEMVNDIEVDSWTPPPLPSALEAFFVRPPPPAPSPRPTPAPITSAPGYTQSTPTANSEQQEVVRNPTPNANWQVGRARIKPMIDEAKAHRVPVPLTDAGRPFCLTYHLKAECHSHCNGTHSHRVLTRGEHARLDAYVRRWCLPAPNQRPAPPVPAAGHNYGTYQQAALPRQTGNQRPGYNARTSPGRGRPPAATPQNAQQAAQNQPPVPVVTTSENNDGTSTLGANTARG